MITKKKNEIEDYFDLNKIFKRDDEKLLQRKGYYLFIVKNKF